VNKELSTVRSHLLRFLCLFSAIVIGIRAWPEIIRPGSPWDLICSVALSLYGAYSLVLLVGVALLISMVGVACSRILSQRTHTGVWRPAGQPRNLLLRVMGEGPTMGIAGRAVGSLCGHGLSQVAGSFLGDLKMPGVLPVAGSVFVLLLAAVIGSVVPAARATWGSM